MRPIFKRIVSIFLTLVMMVGVLPITGVPVFANTMDTVTAQANVTLEDRSGMAGKTVTVPVTINNNPGIVSMTLQIEYDTAVFKLVGVNDTGLFSGAMHSDNYASPYLLTWENDTSRENINVNGTIAELLFEIADDAAEGSYEIKVSYPRDGIYDVDMENVDFAMFNGHFIVRDYLLGDVNGDDNVTNKDRVLLARYLAGWTGYDLSMIAFEGADINCDGAITNKDRVVLARHLAGWSGYENLSSFAICNHSLTATPAKATTCTENGNSAYWSCDKCGKYFADADGKNEIAYADTVIEATNHAGTIVTHAAKAATETEIGWYEWSECTACGYQPIPYVEIPVVVSEQYAIVYNIKSGTDAYLDGLVDAGQITNPNLTHYPEGQSYALKNLTAPAGYVFEGWYDGFGTTAKKIETVPATTKGEFNVYAKWSVTEYAITYSVYGTPIQPVSDEKYKCYTVNKGLYDLPNPDLYNYIFLGWYTDEGEEVKEIPVGTTNDIKLNGYFTSERNLAKAVDKLENPFIVEDVDNNVIYFTYELGTIENVPVSDAIWTIQNVAGLTQQVSHTVTISIGTDEAKSISESIAKATVNSSTWTLSEDWNEVTEINEAWAEEHGITQEEAETIAKSNGNTYCVTQASGGNSSTTNTNGTTVLDYNSVNKSETDSNTHVDENGWNVNAKVSGSYEASATLEAGVEVDAGVGSANTSASATSSFKVGAEIGGGYESSDSDSSTKSNTKDTHTGTDTTKIDTTVSESSASWNNSSSSTQTETASQSNMVSQAISDIITSTKGYGNSYSNGGENSQSQAFNFSQSESNDYTTTLTYSSAEVTTTTTTYTADGKIEGKYRLVMAGTVHVFGVVGYDISTNSYFTYTFNVMDDEIHEFLDYTPKGSDFDDCEYSVIPFEIPYFVYSYINSETAATEGLAFKTNSATKTATVTNYTGTSTDVVVPSFISSGGISYKVTGISATAFAGKNIRAIMLGRYIQSIPAGAFKGCTNLENVSGYFTEIGTEAFSGCISLDNFTVSNFTTSIGTKAFDGVSQITINVLSAENAMNAVKAQNPDADKDQLTLLAKQMTQEIIQSAAAIGANRVILNISDAMLCDSLYIAVPDIEYFELQGGKRSYPEVQIVSDASTTALSMLTINNTKNIPLKISSEVLHLDTVTIKSASFGMMFKADKTTVSLVRDSRLISENGIAIVTKDCLFDAQLTGNVSGYMDISGDIYVCDEVEGTQNITCGKIVMLSEAEYSNYIKGLYTVTFDANGGEVTGADKSVVYGEVMGALPVPIREYYTFNGWFTEPSGGTEVTESTVFNKAEDITLYAQWTLNSYVITFNANGGTVGTSALRGYCGKEIGTLPTPTRDYYTFTGWYTEKTGGTQVTAEYIASVASDFTLYAQWKDNDVIGWVKASEAPAGVQIVERKYSYREYNESTSDSLSGWIKYDTQRTGWSATAGPVYSDPANGVRNVWSEQYITGYTSQYTQYFYSRYVNSIGANGGHYNSGARCYGYASGAMTYYQETGWLDAPLTDKGSSSSSSNGRMYGYDSQGLAWFNQQTRVVGGDPIYGTCWYYQEPIYTHYFYRDLESATNPAGQSNVSNVVEWVMYRNK